MENFSNRGDRYFSCPGTKAFVPRYQQADGESLMIFEKPLYFLRSDRNSPDVPPWPCVDSSSSALSCSPECLYTQPQSYAQSTKLEATVKPTGQSSDRTRLLWIYPPHVFIIHILPPIFLMPWIANIQMAWSVASQKRSLWGCSAPSILDIDDHPSI